MVCSASGSLHRAFCALLCMVLCMFLCAAVELCACGICFFAVSVCAVSVFSTSVSLHFYGVSVSFALSVSMLLCGICFFSSLVSVSFLCVTMCASV